MNPRTKKAIILGSIIAAIVVFGVWLLSGSFFGGLLTGTVAGGALMAERKKRYENLKDKFEKNLKKADQEYNNMQDLRKQRQQLYMNIHQQQPKAPKEVADKLEQDVMQGKKSLDDAKQELREFIDNQEEHK